jgi:hypothetical protein
MSETEIQGLLRPAQASLGHFLVRFQSPQLSSTQSESPCSNPSCSQILRRLYKVRAQLWTGFLVSHNSVRISCDRITEGLPCWRNYNVTKQRPGNFGHDAAETVRGDSYFHLPFSRNPGKGGGRIRIGDDNEPENSRQTLTFNQRLVRCSTSSEFRAKGTVARGGQNHTSPTRLLPQLAGHCEG